jgi:hypothetical protein
LNSEFTMQRAEDFAVRVNGLVGPNAPTEKKVEMAFLLALARKPTADETRWSALHLEKQRQRYLGLKTSAEESSKKALANLCQMLLGTNEFLYVE